MQQARLDVQRRFSKIKQGQFIHLQELVTTTDPKRYLVCLNVFSSLAGFLGFRKISMSYDRLESETRVTSNNFLFFYICISLCLNI